MYVTAVLQLSEELVVMCSVFCNFTGSSGCCVNCLINSRLKKYSVQDISLVTSLKTYAHV